MDFNSIQRIVETEQAAEKIKIDAEEEARKILADLKNKEENVKLFHQNQLKRRVEEFKISQEEETKKKIENIQYGATKTARVIKESCEKNIDTAVEEIFKIVVTK